MLKGSRNGNASRKTLADVTNLQQQPEMQNKNGKQQVQPKMNDQNQNELLNLLLTNEFVGELQKENMMLEKLVLDRDKIIQLSGIELQKLRTNLQKLQLQNKQLAQTNSQILAELNAGKDKLKTLQHELGCKNGFLNLRKLELERKALPVSCQSSANEVGRTNSSKLGESSHATKEKNHPCAKRRRQSKRLSSGPSVLKRVLSKEKAEDERELAEDKSEEPEQTEEENQRLSDGSRPVRRAVQKVQSYKEVSVNVKMRRPE